jgi:hypothetical protein
MAISARLSRTLQQRLGDGAADDLVNWMVKVDASRSELRELMESYNARIDGRFAEQQSRIDSRFAEQQIRMDAGFAQLESRLDAKLEQRSAGLLKWSFLFWCGAVGAIAALARVLK